MSDERPMGEEGGAGLAIQVDKWGFRYRGTPGDLGEKAPATWAEVWGQVRRHLMRLVSGVPRLLAEAVEGVTRLARSTLSGEAAGKVRAAHDEADFWEKALRRYPVSLGVCREGQRDARRVIEAILERYRRGGYVAEIAADGEGRPVLVIVASGIPGVLLGGRAGAVPNPEGVAYQSPGQAKRRPG